MSFRKREGTFNSVCYQTSEKQICADVVNRVTIFFRVAAASVSAQFVAPLISAALMTWTPWIPMVTGALIMVLSIFTAYFLPETLKYNKSPQDETNSPLSSASSYVEADKELSTWQKVLDGALDSTAFLISDVRILLIMPAFFLHMLFINRDTLLQYISTRYAVSLSRATVLISIRSGLVMLLCLIILPAVNHLFRKRLGFGPRRSDLLLSRASTIAMAVGFLLIAFAPSIPLLITAMVVQTFGWGLTLFLRSLMTSLVESHHVARLNTAVGVFDTVGLMVGSPLLAFLFEKGVEVGGLWLGLPFLVCAGAVAVIGVILGGISVGRDEVGEGGDIMRQQVHDTDDDHV
jgi:hypothetical protein